MKEISIPDLSILGQKWLESKIQRMQNLLKITQPDEALYREFMLSLGYPKNKANFLELSLMLPFREVRKLKYKDIIEKALLYRAGFINTKEGLPEDFDFSLRMDKSLWNLKKIRPVNFPDKRIKGISNLLSEAVESGLANFFIKRILNENREITNQKEAQKCVERIMDFKGVGIERKREIFFNIILPFTIAFLEDEYIVEFLNSIFNIHPPISENSLIKKFKSIVGEYSYTKLNISTKTYFGIIFYMKEQNDLSK